MDNNTTLVRKDSHITTSFPFTRREINPSVFSPQPGGPSRIDMLSNKEVTVNLKSLLNLDQPILRQQVKNGISGITVVESSPSQCIDNDEKISSLCEIIARKDYAILSPEMLRELLIVENPTILQDWNQFQGSWNCLEQDQYMKDGGTYRLRRHSIYSASATSPIRHEQYQPHYQSFTYNTLNGGIARYFTPIAPEIASGKVLMSLLACCRSIVRRLAPLYNWHIEVHQFRILATHTETLPTPEGIHRDGVSFVFMMLINRVNVLGGETRLYEREGKEELIRYTLVTPFEGFLLNDERTLHEVTPIRANDPLQQGYRDILVITFDKR